MSVKNTEDIKTTKGRGRRRFLKGAAATAAGGAAVIAFPQGSRAQTVTLKMQSS